MDSMGLRGPKFNPEQIKMTFRSSHLVQLFFLIVLLVFASAVQAKPFKVLVVMSYEEDNPWCQEIKQGIDSVLGKSSEISYFYMDTKVNLVGGKAKSKQAFDLYRKLQPDGVITVDDNAQSMFVLPYLKEKVKTPVMFCGVNADAAKYGYPTSHISGILERGHVRESIAFLEQLHPAFSNISFIVKESPSGHALKKQVEAEADSYLAKVKGFHLLKTTEELKQVVAGLDKESDAVFIDSVEGITDDSGKKLVNREVLSAISGNFAGPIIGANKYHVDQGVLSAVVKTGQEQGETAASMLLKAMQGEKLSAIPISQNYQGRRYINVSTMESLGITPRPIVLRGASLVRTK